MDACGQWLTWHQPVDLHTMLTEMSTTIPAPGISIGAVVPRGTATTGNADELSRLFRNLVDNAVRYARHRVLITAVPATDRIVLADAAGGGTRAVVTCRVPRAVAEAPSSVPHEFFSIQNGRG
jgi:signal transduction histidine kinase